MVLFVRTIFSSKKTTKSANREWFTAVVLGYDGEEVNWT